jgi:hypothetical protein
MFTPRLNTVFASRWRALWFSGVVLLTAYCSVPDAPVDPASAASAQATDAAAAQRAIDDSSLSPEERAQAEATLKALESLGQ